MGPAVVRNRVRRRIRACLAELDRSGEAPLPPGALLVSAGPAVVRYRPEELRNDVLRLLAAIPADPSPQDAS